ncbi:MAG: lamin tail domain-containing protein, partial [Verrucomicrobiales bacterium]
MKSIPLSVERWRASIFSAVFLLALACSAAGQTTEVLGSSGNISNSGGVDGWNSNMIINEVGSYTNSSGGVESIEVTKFRFVVGNNRGRVTPFVVRLNDLNSNGNTTDDDNFTVLSIGTTRASGADYSSTGVGEFDFVIGGPVSINLADGETIAAGFIDSDPDGQNGGGSVIPFSNAPAVSMWYNGQSGTPHPSPIAEGTVLSGGSVSGVNRRDYQFQIDVQTAPPTPQPPSPPAFAPSLDLVAGFPAGIELGMLSATDPNPGDTVTLSLVPGFGDNSLFQVVEGGLRMNSSLPGATAVGTTFSIRVRAADGGGLTSEATHTLEVVTSHQPTSVSLGASSAGIATPIGTAVAEIGVDDSNLPGDQHSFTLVAGAGDTHNGLFSISGNGELVLEQSLVGFPAGSLIQVRIMATDLGGNSAQSALSLTVTEPSVRINEFLASNAGGLTDEDGDSSDWIELFNETGSAVNLNGWYLTDSAGNLRKWQFPNTTLAADGYLIVFASGKNRAVAGAELHTGFQLGSGGEYLALVRPDGSVADAFGPAYPEQFPDIAYGNSGISATRGYLEEPTPSAKNGTTSLFGNNQVTFSSGRGFYSAPVSVALSAALPGSTIRYTLDGSAPSAGSGMVYSGPISIDGVTGAATNGSRGTVTLRAIAVNDDAAVAPIETHSYFFVSEIVSQSVMDTRVTGDATYGPMMEPALLGVPTVSIVRGGSVGTGESETSIEFIDPSGGEPGFQVDCGIKRVGGHSLGAYPKNNMRLYFRSEYGKSKLSYPLFDGQPLSDGATSEFDRLHLRSGSHDTVFYLANSQPRDASYTRNRWIGDMQKLMGHETMHGRWCHVYIDGTYHGHYQLMERASSGYFSAYFGGSKDDWAYVNKGTDPDVAAWNTVKSQASSSYANATSWVDLENLVDYMLLNYYCGNTWDWNPTQNWMAGGSREADHGGWKFFGWDSDIIFQNVRNNNLGKNVPDGLFNSVKNYPEMKVMIRDKIYQHFFHGGLLTPSKVAETYAFRMDQIRPTLVAETARWQPNNFLWDIDGEWQAAWDSLNSSFFPQRTGIVLDQFRSSGLYPVEAAEFDMRGGVVPVGHQPVLTTTSPGTIYYTTDGSDPRLADGSVSPSASLFNGGTSRVGLIPLGGDWNFLDDGSDLTGTDWHGGGAFDDSSWSEGPAELGYGDGDEATVIGYGPSPGSKYITSYFRKTIDLASFGVTDLNEIAGDLSGSIQYDDGAVVYMNGHEVGRFHMPDGAIDSSTRASSGGNENAYVDFSIPKSFLVPGENVIAVEVHQSSGGSSDLSFDLDLDADVLAAATGLTITEHTVINVRVLDGAEWSAVNQASFVIEGTEPASTANTVISEIHYNPSDPGAYEFIEFRNIADHPVDLSGVVVSAAVDFTFPAGIVLNPGEHTVIVEDEAAFLSRYGDAGSPWSYPGIRVAGEWTGSLKNSTETIAVTAADLVTDIATFSYDDGESWPGRADGRGSSIELELDVPIPTGSALEKNLFLGNGSKWRPSSEFHGSPGRDGSGPDNRIVINEVLANSPVPTTDTVEFLNTTGSAIGIGGWLVSDSGEDYAKFTFPAATTISAGGFLVLDESDFNAGLKPFALSGSEGDDVILVETDSGGNRLGFVDSVEFGASAEGEAFGRWPDGSGRLYPMAANTFGDPNASAGNTVRNGPVVITEIHYNPDGADENLEFVQIRNSGPGSENLTNWRLRGEADFDFPAGLSLASGEALLILGFDPANSTLMDTFEAAYPAAIGMRRAGPWGGGAKLDDGGGTIKLQRPDALFTPVGGGVPFYPMLAEDTVRYDDESGWPAAADGTGASL